MRDAASAVDRFNAREPDFGLARAAELLAKADVSPPNQVKHGEMTMQKRFGIAVVSALLASPLAAQAQGIPAGAQRGAAEGSDVGGPVGGVVGVVVGGVAGGVGGLLGVNEVPRFHDYVIREHRSSYRYREDPRVGMTLPSAGITYYRVPREFGVSPRYRYTVVNEQPVLVDPRTRRVIQVID